MKRYFTLAALICLFAIQPLFAQFDFPSLSPKGEIMQVVGNTEVHVEYERPAARGRKVFGELVPWNQLWRTGAGHCTKIQISKAVEIGGQAVPAGKYSLFSIPGPESWIIILNADTTLYGTYGYDNAKDVARFIATPQKSHRFYESLTIDIDVIPNNARIYLSWEHTLVSFDLQTTTEKEVQTFIQEDLLNQKAKESDTYASAAEYLLYQNKDYFQAIELTDMAISLNPSNGWARRLKMELYEKVGFYQKALEVAQNAITHTTNQQSKQEWEQAIQRIQEKIGKGLEKKN